MVHEVPAGAHLQRMRDHARARMRGGPQADHLRTQHDRPIWLGEFGEGTKDWVSGVVKLMEDHQVGWAVYPWRRKQTFFWNPVLQMIPPTPKWYAVAAYLAQPADGKVAVPSSAEAEAGMAEILGAMKLANCTEDGGLANAIIKP